MGTGSRCRLAAIACALSMGLAGGTAHAWPERALDTWAPDAVVQGMAMWEDRVIVSGSFDDWAPVTGSSAMLDLESGAADLEWPEVNGTVNAIARDEAGGSGSAAPSRAWTAIREWASRGSMHTAGSWTAPRSWTARSWPWRATGTR